eukprot:11563919-Ditylum_brightwellii.AAC.1
MQSDDNVQQAIEQMLEEFAVPIPSVHVPSHQDEGNTTSLKETLGKKTDSKCTWKAQLNIVADKLAGIAQRQIKQLEKTTFDLLPGGKVYLFINNKAITRNIAKEIIKAVELPKLKDYLKGKFG